ncbi:hypothetical protein F5883DRAFT_542815 [Diaporthe sp. PMI_573]|nr:hypothetical protein F5883DRAFT_542815 [Diaporthaceae sp. PMI_573]
MLFILTSLLAVAQLVAGICYWPDGSVDTRGYECNTTAVAQGGHTSCCLHDDACYKYGSCFQDWSGIMYRQSCTDQTWKDPSCPLYCLQKDQLDVSVWIQSCDLHQRKACCVRDKDTASSSCCNSSANLFAFKPGYIQAVINGDGTNRLSPYVGTDGNTLGAPTSTASTDSEASSSNNTSALAPTAATTGATATATAGDTGGLPTHVGDAVIAIGVVLGCITLVTIALLVFVWRKLAQERRLRREGQKLLRRREKETWPQLTHQTAFQIGESGVAGGRGEMYAGEPGALIRELPMSPRVGELGA